MGERRRVVLGIFFATFLHISYGCQMDGVTNWAIPQSATIFDHFRGTVLSRSTGNIEGIISVTYGEATLQGPYFDISLVDSQFVIETNAAYADYEEHEVSTLVSITVDFRCSGVTPSNSLIFLISITDTNNNSPAFIPTNAFEFVVTPPLPPGYIITGCLDYVTVRDIDLTTQRIDFTIDDNPYFEIEYDAAASTEAKEFKAVIRTTTFIRSLSEPLTYTITATDVDLTEGPPLSATASLRIVADSEFQFPEEPIFGQAFYLANYTETHQLNLFETISLQQGFDEYVNFDLEGEYRENFDLIPNGNELSLDVITPLPIAIWSQRQTYLIVRATREYTSGDTTTVVVQFPEEEPLQFESAIYEGAIINNALQVSQLMLTQGYEGTTISPDVVGEYSSYFTASVEGNLITLSMLPLSAEIIENNSLISIQVIVSSDRSVATTVVNLEVIKDDNVTPVFDKSIYYAIYDPDTGLNAEQITFVQGFDDNVNVELDGDFSNLFNISQEGLIITITSMTIPPELYSLQNILISIEATKPRTVGANAAISIALPAAREIEFEESIYRGTIQDNEIRLDTIQLRMYEDGVNFQLSGEYSTYFTATDTEQGQVLISLSSALPDTVVTQNNVILLTLTASGTNFVPTSTNILLDIIKEDSTTPVFTRNIYYGTYATTLQIEDINLAQGFDNGVTFRLDGAHAQYFSVSNGNGNNAVITLQSPIPEEVIFNEKVLLFNVLADKALTVGANAAVLITFPTELTDAAVMRFSQNAYIGQLEENDLTLENIVLDTGFATGTEFLLSGDYLEHFSLDSATNVVQISSLGTLPSDVIENNEFLILEIEARRQRAVSAWTSVIVDIVKQDIVTPVFNQAYYTGVYTEEIGLMFEETINLEEGYDETVTFALVGEWSSLFRLEQDDNTASLVLAEPMPTEIVENYNQLLLTVVAENSHNLTGRAVISIDLPKDFLNSTFRFSKDNYKGYIEDGNLTIEEIVLQDYTNDVTYSLDEEYTQYFQVTSQGNGIFTLQIQNPLPEDVLEQTNVLILTLNAQNSNFRTHAAIVIEIVKITEEIIEFEQPYYIGSYSEITQLEFNSEIRITDTGSVLYQLEGDDAQWFGLQRNENSVTVVLTSPIPAGVISNNQQLVFVVTAQRPSSATARATVVIELTDELTENSAILGFDRVTYVGSIENGQSNIPLITLSEGYVQGVQFALLGELSNYFSVTPQGAVVTIALQNAIPEQSIPANGIILLELQATAPGAIPAVATIVVEYVVDEDVSTIVELIFAQTFYSGSYSAAAGLSFPTPLSLSDGYDSTVVFALEGDNAQWFGLQRNENSVTVVLTSPIPAGVISNNQQLVFVVTAQRPSSATARATVVIELTDELTENSAILGFDRVTYVGSIENGQSNIPLITLSEGYVQGVQFALLGELSDYFSVTPQGAVVTIALQNAIPEQSIPSNGIILLELQATAPGAIPAVATIVVEYVVDEDVSTIVELIFAQTFYSGSYSAAAGLSFPTPLSLSDGYDSTVVFALEGDNAQWFGLQRNENSVTVVLTSPIPAGVISNNQQLVFVVTAQRPSSATARATVVIELTDELTENSAILGFDRVTYVGSIENGQSNIPLITLSEGYVQGVQFALLGELSDYFSVTPQGAVVTIALQNAIPEQSIPSNGIILLELQATAPGAIPAVATIVVEYVVDEDVSTIVELIFAQTFYSGSYSAAAGLSFPTPLSLSDGYDSTVVFALEGDNAQWFGLQRNENSVTVMLTSPIPAGVISNNQQLVFVVTAQRPSSATARATVVIELTDELTENSAILGFDRVTYVGSIENGQSNIPLITLSEGYVQGVQFALLGELSDYFSVTPQGAVVTIALQNAIPEQSIPANGIILLELQATAPGAIPAVATIVVEYVVDEDVSTIVELIFAQTFYSGSYSAAAGLSFPTPLSLSDGYDPTVVFALEGDNAQWFGLQRNENSVTVVLTSPIPAGVISNNQQLVFVVTAQRPSSATARATVVIELTDDLTENSAILGFDRVTYVGSIENGQPNIPLITLSEGYVQGVQFALLGELSDYFSVTPQGAVVTIALQNAIPEQSIPSNGIILLELQATAPGAIPAVATIVVEYVVDEDVSTIVELIFAQTFYSGSYSAAAGLSFPTPLSLSDGYDSTVVFALEGDNAQWFGLQRNENSVTVVLTSPIPAGVISNNQQLVFVVTAQRPSSATARATVVIELTDELTENSAILGFDRVTYVGSIENGQSNIPLITLSEGYVQGVQFALLGELSDYFSVTPQGAVVTIALQNAIPEQSIPSNGIILLELQATAPGAIPAVATIVVEYVVDEDVSTIVELIFAQTFYSGSYSAAAGLSFPTPLSLSDGYDSTVVFALEGDNAQWFGLQRNENSVTVVLTSPIPAGVISNNQQLVFVVTAQRPSSATARATVVIELTDELTENSAILGFDRVTYVGSIENGQSNIPLITLSEGYVQGVQFALLGELSNYFSVTPQGAVVTIALQNAIPEQSIPANGIILLELQATAPGAIPAVATIVVEYVVDEDVSTIVELIFAQTFYSGSYSAAAGLSFPTPLSLSDGYDPTVVFALEGDNAQWFGLQRNENSVTVVLTSPIPAGVISNNQQLVFVVTAQRPSSATARATVVIELTDELTENSAILGFDRVTYVGSIENGQSNIPLITLSEGNVQGVQFALLGELSDYFSVTPQGAVVTIALQNAIPEQSIPSNGIILLELQATAPGAIPAVATIVVEYVVDEDVSTIVELIFAQTFYSGSYSAAAGLSFPTPLSLSDGYDSTVVFALEGDNAQWFGLQRNENSVTVVLTSPIPAGVISNNQQLVFVVTAQRPSSATARATVVIELTDELTENSAILGFDRVTYVGSIENGQSNIPLITLSEGYVQGVQFALLGELSDYFSVTPQGAVVTIALQNAIPEQSIPSNGIILLELQATAPGAIPAVATIVVEYVVDEDVSTIVELIFAQTFYSGSYSAAAGLSFPTPLSLSDGYDSTVVFALEGDNAQWFGLQRNENSVTVVLTSPIPAGVISNNQQLVFVVTAQRPSSATARATVVIELTDELTENSAILGFDRVTYVGSIENGQSNIPLITLSEGYVQGVQFALLGELSNYFSVTPQGAVVTIALQNAIPEQSIPSNGIILLELQATAPGAIPAVATIVVEYVVDEDVSTIVELIFAQTFYSGSYSAAAGLSFPTPLSLSDGYDSTVVFALEGDNAQWFGLQRNENSVTVVLTSPIPAGVISNNQQLVFVVTAQRPSSATARATVVIELTDELTENSAILGFDRVTYVGSIENGQSNIPLITLSEGYVQGVQFALLGELSDYFSVTPQGAVVTIALQNAIPEQSIPSNGIILLELQATAPGAIPAVATIVVEYVVDEDVSTIVELIFAQTFYSGSYSAAAGLSFPTPLSLSDGYDSTVVFALEGDNAQWFGLQRNENSVTVVLTSPIPAGVISNNQQLVFVVTAQRPSSATARATVVIELTDELTENSAILGFDRVTYVGSIENGQSNIPLITLSEGYVQGVQFALLGELSNYFSVTPQGAVVTIALQNAIPEQSIPANGIILLELQATAPGAIPAVATIVVEYVVDEDVSTIVELIFAQTFYSGSYSAAAGLSFPTPLSLSDGYDPTVVFALEGDNAQWFGLQRNENSVTVVLTSPIPAGVISNNQQLVFVVTAQRPSSATARATVVIELTDELTENSAILGFDRVTYVGSIENGQSNIPLITLSEGNVQGVQFALLGELSDYFSVTPQGAVVTIALQNAIPEQSIPSNGIILLELQATAPGAIPAVATIVVEYVVDEDVSTIVELIFAQTFYSGSYSAAAGLSFPTPLSLSDGYDSTVVFALEGDNAQWFGLQRNENSVTVVLTSPIPAGVISNNQQLVFVVTAQRPSSATARATVVIELTDELTENSAILGFDRVTYVGSIENGQSNIPLITLSEGYVQGVQFALLGELSDYFSVTPQGAVVTIALQNAIPEQSIPSNGIILLELQATAPGAIPAVATIVVEYVVDEDVSTIVELIFAQTFYSGSYSAAAGLSFPTPLSLSDGYDSTVVFALEGDNAQWFGLQRNENSVTVVLTSPIPAGVISNNQQLVFVVTAQRPSSATARATVVIELTDELTENSAILGFDRVTYVGSIENGQSNIPLITLSEGYVQGVQFALLGELSDYFSVTPQGAVVTIALQNAIPEQSIPANGIILLELQATAPGAIPAVATIVVEYVVDEDVSTIVELIFAQTFYSGSYSAAAGLSFPTPLSLSDGYDSTVVFALEGDNAQWFGLQRNENSVTVVLTSPIPAGVISNNQQLVFVVTAQRPSSATARATVVIELTDELTENSAILGFDRVTYVGSIENGQSNIPLITLSEGYVQGVQFALLGELSDYFSVTPQGAVVTIALQNAIPEQSIPSNGIILLELQATAPGAIPAVATIVVEYVVDEDVSTIVELIFAQTFYSGSYSAAAGLSFPTPLSLSDGYDSTVVFALEGDNAQWFGLQRNENSVTVVLTSPIPAGVISNNQQLVFVVTAQRPSSATARATVVIELTDELTENSAILGFDRVTYVGSIENGQSNIPLITLSEGYVQGVQFALLGELSDYFSVTPQGAVVTIALQNAIPEQSIPANGIILLELQATAPGAIPAVATIVVEYVVDEDVSTIVELIFAQTFYSGSYSAAAGLSFPTPLSLSDGYDSTVVFALEGDNAQWFGLQRNENSVTVVLTSPIPAGVISNNQQLVFVVTAQRPSSATARATVVIELTDELTENSAILGFDRVTYVGSIENGQSNIPLITLSEGYVQGVQFALLGELSDYFSVTPQGAVVTIALQNAIPEQSIPSNGIILLELQATAPGAIPAVATIVVEYVVDEDVSTIVELIFAQTFYSGSYSAAAGLSFPTPLSLSDGYDSTVVFALEGDNAQWFGLQRNENSVTVVLTSPIPAGVISNNQQLVFVVTAQRPSSATARATVVIELTDELTENSAILGFDRVTYVGSIENGQSNIPLITLSEGYVQGVQFALLGELSDYFSVTPQGAVVTIALQNAIPEQSIPSNGIILLELQATAPGAIPAVATIVVEYVVDEDVSTIVELIFAQTFYSGSYSAAAGLSFPTPLSLSDGYDSTVVFALEGDNAQWFGLQRNENSVTVVLTSPIPAGVISNNQQLVFVVTAQRPSSATARATVVIELTDELTENSAILGFDRVTYVGSIENGQSNIPLITLSEGYVQGVQFALLGELSDYFSVTPQGAVVTIALQNAIPEQSIPANGIILLELQATAPGAIPAVATIVVEYVVDEDVSTIVELIFAQTFYSGSYSAAAGLSFPTPLSLSDGYDSTVVFALEGDNAQWFGLQRNENSVTVALTSPIPAGVISNNQQLVFVVTAQRPSSATARATVVIELTDELTENSAILGFDRVTYVGSIENGQSNIPLITLSEGYVQGVQFALLGELSDYFSVTPQGAVVTIALQNAIPEQSIPSNGIILLELQATAPGAIPAVATIVVEYVVDEDVSTIVELIFAQTFYSGSYSAAAGLSFPTPLSLSDGYDSTVVFALEGDNAQWFGLQRNENSVTVVLTSPIPAGVISNNQQLVFVVTAQRPSSATARATVVIELTDELTENSAILGFDRVTYVGSIENGQSNIPLITLSEGYVQGVQFALLGELSDYFSVTPQGAVVTIALQNAIPEQSIPANGIILLELQATAPGAIPAVATIVVEYVVDEDVSTIVELIFAQTFYSGSYSAAAGLSFPTPLSLSDGYDSTVVFALEGDNAQWFGLQRNENSVTVVLTSPIPAGVISNNQQLVFVVTAQRPSSATARATVVIELTDESQAGSDVTFEKVLFEGIVQNGVVSHETIIVTGFSGSNVELHGEYSTLFEPELSNNEVRVQVAGSLTLPADVTHIALELRAGTAATVLLLNVIQTDGPSTPTVTFSSASYAIRLDIIQTGLIGQVQATSDNGENVIYSLMLNNAHLEERLSVNSEGELLLWAPVNNGLYTFQVIATTVFTQIPGTATVHLSVDAVTVCGGENVVAPLIILDVDEEEPHHNLIDEAPENCHFTLTNRWPLDQSWLYIDEGGLHTTAIDREHESIAFMPVSQVQVEIILHCEGDATRSKRSVTPDPLGPYDYGNNKWILTDTITHNSRRSFVNLIVNDINDNAPIFVGKESEPIAVGYVIPDLAERVLPRSLAELQATDADIGENAALLYWSSAPELAVAPTTGFVHVSDGSTLTHGARYTVHATDRNGDGLTGSIDILVRLLDESNIAVVTVRDAFLDDEQTVLSHLSEGVGYDVKVLRSVVISDSETSEESSRKRRDVTDEAGASLQLYVYGLIEREPVAVDRLTTDISNIALTAVIVASTVSLEDHLEALEICVIAGRDTGLLVATIVLSVLLFIVLVLIAVWFFLRWRRKKNYDQFSDENSIASRNESVDKFARPEVFPKPRLDIAELKKSERRLQEMLDAPDEVITEPNSSRNDAILDLSIPEPVAPVTPIFIQSIDKLKDAADESSEDEFGEVKSPRRKSVVTFNENVEKIIHLEDNEPEDISTDTDYEIYKL